MIYLHFEGQYEQRHPTAVFEAPDGLDVSYDAFLISLGVPAFPYFNIRDRDDVWAWEKRRRQWVDERDRILAANGITDGEAAHRRWLEQHPQVRSLPFLSWE